VTTARRFGRLPPPHEREHAVSGTAAALVVAAAALSGAPIGSPAHAPRTQSTGHAASPAPAQPCSSRNAEELPQEAPPDDASNAMARTRTRVPEGTPEAAEAEAHVSEHCPHADHADSTQSTAHAAVPHDRDPAVAVHALPPAAARRSTLRRCA
jgi:hypothetical protein